MRRNNLRGRILACALVAVVTLAAGCSTDDDIGGFSVSCLTFIPAEVPTTGEVTSVWGLESTCSQTEVELVVTGVDDIWSASFEVDYPEELMGFAAVQTGDSFLREDGADVSFIVQENPPGSGLLEIGISRVDTLVNKGISPTEDNPLLIRLVFIRFASGGTGEFLIQDAKLKKVENVGDLESDFDPPIVFSGGTFAIES